VREVDDAIAVLEVTASNIRSLGPAGALGFEPWKPYQIWLAEVEGALTGLRQVSGRILSLRDRQDKLHFESSDQRLHLAYLEAALRRIGADEPDCVCDCSEIAREALGL